MQSYAKFGRSRSQTASSSFSKRRRITERQIEEYLGRLKALPIAVEPGDLWLNVGLEAPARRWNLTPYDAAYLDLALRKGLPLATVDASLKKAATEEGAELI